MEQRDVEGIGETVDQRKGIQRIRSNDWNLLPRALHSMHDV